MTKTLLDLDDALLAEATDALGTSTKKDTVVEALRIEDADFETVARFVSHLDQVRISGPPPESTDTTA